jgi:hypothetical protein
LTSYLLLGGNPAKARIHAIEVLSLVRHEGGYFLRLCFESWALLAALGGKSGEAARLIGFVDAEYARTGDMRQPTEQGVRDELARRLTAQLPAADIEAWAAEGARWSEEQATEFVEHDLVSTAPTAA